MSTTIERRSIIPAPVEAVWSTLGEFGAISAWAPNVDHSCLLSSQTEGPGTVRRIQASRATIVETVEVWAPGETLSYRITGLPSVIRRLTNTWRLEPEGDATSVVLTTSIDTGPRPPQRLIARAAGRRMASASEQMLSGLADHLATTNRPPTEGPR
ncbi:MAG: SRPBCC family protein [Acidimicrobiales bacterium]